MVALRLVSGYSTSTGHFTGFLGHQSRFLAHAALENTNCEPFRFYFLASRAVRCYPQISG
jgi:hypothetical protein